MYSFLTYCAESCSTWNSRSRRKTKSKPLLWTTISWQSESSISIRTQLLERTRRAIARSLTRAWQQTHFWTWWTWSMTRSVNESSCLLTGLRALSTRTRATQKFRRPLWGALSSKVSHLRIFPPSDSSRSRGVSSSRKMASREPPYSSSTSQAVFSMTTWRPKKSSWVLLHRQSRTKWGILWTRSSASVRLWLRTTES